MITIICTAFLAAGLTGFFAYPKVHVAVFGETVKVHGSVAHKSKTELIGSSDVIIRGTVKELLPSKWSNPDGEKGPEARNIIQTDIVVGIEQIFKGTPFDSHIKVRVNEGQVENIKWDSEGYPDFNLGEEVILFLSKDDSDLTNPNENYYVLTGMFQGKFNQIENTSKFSNSRDQIDLSTFKAEIPAEMKKYKTLPKPADPQSYQP
jgi:hypothetical protein